jgi:hypothetical protein
MERCEDNAILGIITKRVTQMMVVTCKEIVKDEQCMESV